MVPLSFVFSLVSFLERQEHIAHDNGYNIPVRLVCVAFGSGDEVEEAAEAKPASGDVEGGGGSDDCSQFSFIRHDFEPCTKYILYFFNDG